MKFKNYEELNRQANKGEANTSSIKISEILEGFKGLILNSEHYSGNIETIDFIKDKLTAEQFEGYLIGNTIKYLSRYNKKGKEYKDLQKGGTYYLWLLKLMSGNN